MPIIGYVVWFILLQRLWQFAVGEPSVSVGDAIGEMLGAFLLIGLMVGVIYLVMYVFASAMHRPRVPLWPSLAVVTGVMLLGTIGVQWAKTQPAHVDVVAQPEQIAPPAAPVQAADAKWALLTSVWEKSNAEFMADPERARVMREAIIFIDAQYQGRISGGRLIALAEDKAFTQTGWKFRDPKAWNAEWRLLLRQWEAQNQSWLADPSFAAKMNAAINDLSKEKNWERPGDLLAAAEQRVIKDLRVSNDVHASAAAAAQRAARQAARRGATRAAPDPQAMEQECYKAHRVASANPPFGSIAVYAQWKKRNQTQLDACLAGRR